VSANSFNARWLTNPATHLLLLCVLLLIVYPALGGCAPPCAHLLAGGLHGATEAGVKETERDLESSPKKRRKEKSVSKRNMRANMAAFCAA
jgi:hypothetical protein